MRSYNQFCPIAKAAELFCERWTALIIRELAGGGARFAQIQRGVPLASPTIVASRLKQLEQEGVVTREKTASGNAWQYRLTAAGKEFVPIVMALGIWGQRWSRRELAEHEIDLGLLLWALEKGADARSFDARRTVIEFDITDQPEHKRHWWYLNEDGHCELCVSAPDRDADIHVTATLPDLIYVWRGDLQLARAIDNGRLEVVATARLRRAFNKWFAIASIADVGPASAA
ncbi:MAG: helix-turn-helix domain-containing protein [Rhizobiaceae bacterium]